MFQICRSCFLMIISDENIDHLLNCNQQRNQSLWSKKKQPKTRKNAD